MIERLLAPNPSLYTGQGTNTYIVSDGGEALVIDPGPQIDVHAAAIVAALQDVQAVAVLATHTHPDHAPMANPLAAVLDVPVYGFAPGPDFVPDMRLEDGSSVAVGRMEVVAVHTPGHTSDHLCFMVGDVLLTGDHIMGGSSVVIEDAAAYLDSLYLVQSLGVERLEPGHGDAMDDAGVAVDEYINHRLERERQLVVAVAQGARTVGDLVDIVYAGIPDGLRHAAAQQVGVQLVKLSRDGAVWFEAGSGSETSEVRPR
jgi:glyoxylase-like metal-dependent hydrolase (beta-lactamase superfamily II)